MISCFIKWQLSESNDLMFHNGGKIVTCECYDLMFHKDGKIVTLVSVMI